MFGDWKNNWIELTPHWATSQKQWPVPLTYMHCIFPTIVLAVPPDKRGRVSTLAQAWCSEVEDLCRLTRHVEENLARMNGVDLE